MRQSARVEEDMDQVFNELSLSASLADEYSARPAILRLKEASDRLTTLGFSRQIRVTHDVAERQISPGRTLRRYLQSPAGGQERTLRQWLLSRFSRAPYVEQLCTEQGITELEEYHIGNERCKGLALAALWGIPALSLSGDERFMPPHTVMTHSFLTEENGELQEEHCRVGIIREETDVRCHETAIQKILYVPLNDGIHMLAYARQQLDCLAFSATAEEQLEGILEGNPWLPRIHAILQELQRAMQEAIARNTIFNPKGFKYKPTESASATEGKKGQKHTFDFIEYDSQGNRNIFSLLCQSHMSITDGDRVYFCPDRNKGKVYIGHVGEHLPTKKYG